VLPFDSPWAYSVGIVVVAETEVSARGTNRPGVAWYAGCVEMAVEMIVTKMLFWMVVGVD